MIFSKKDHESVGQNTQVKKPKKHDANLQKNTTLYFQVGLILTLFAVYGMLEMQFKKHEVVIENPSVQVEPDYYVNYIPEPKQKEEVKQKVEPVKKQLLAINFTPVKDDSGIEDITKNIITEPIPSGNKDLNPEDITVFEEDEPVNIMAVEQVPIYPGCEGLVTNSERRKCMSEKLGNFVRKKFNTDLAGDLGLDGRQRITVVFKIDKSGNVSEINAKAKHPKLEKEAIRVASKLPQMIPGKQKDKNVEVIYSLPILFKVRY